MQLGERGDGEVQPWGARVAACGPAAVTSVPATSRQASTAVLVTISPRTAPGTRGRACPSPSDAAATSCTASHTRTIERTKCTATDHQASCSSTVIPPITAWATTPSGWTSASRVSLRLRGRVANAARKQAAAMTTTRKVSIRLPNSIHWVTARVAGCATGTRLPG